jgi:nijmegen breakage syndrome protein 1
MDIDHDEAQHGTTQTRSSRKRATPPIQYEEKEEVEDFMDQLAPAAAALKKRRVAEETARRRRGESTPPPAPSVIESPVPESPQPKKVKKEVDLLGLARHQREKAEELARKEREALQEAMNGMDIEAIRNLAIIEEIEVLRQPPPVRAVQADESDRWNDRWNGRKNFKKFRRRGAEGGRAGNFNRVIVPLEEVKKKDFGIGDDYWLENDNTWRKKKGKGQDTPLASQSHTRPAGTASTRAAEILAAESEEDPVADADELPSDVEILDEDPVPVAPARSQRSQRPASTSQKQPVANNKRPAAASLTKPAPAKKARQAVTKRKEESDDSDDELKFRFRS